TSGASHVPSEGAYVTLIGTKGGAEIIGDKLTIYTEMHGQQVDITPAYTPRAWADCIVAEIVHLVTCIRDKKTPMSTGEQGMEMMKILEGIYKSADQGKTIKIG
ncbi:MAG: Gfo/Idh/MocA family oxidoreductase, partial [Candidatus Latescibacteria bacterium]|nr:Gfo/Idh/MocA family oxidoreductase [Candidatus Latescibacterota bacterium]